MRISTLDRKVLNKIQDDIPLTYEPFKILAKRVGMGEAELIERIKKLKAKGILRDYAARLNHRRLGFKSTLLGLKVSGDKLEEIAQEIIKYSEVTHCFQRRADYNLWIVFVYKNGREKEFLKKIAKKIGRNNILNLKTVRQFKLKTRLKL